MPQPRKKAPKTSAWSDDVAAAWDVGDASAVRELMQRPDADGDVNRYDADWWRELARRALNRSNMELLSIASNVTPKSVFWMGDGYAPTMWAALNGNSYGVNGGQSDDFHREVAQRAEIDMPICQPLAQSGAANGCARDRWRPMHAAAHHKNAKLIELYAKNGHSPDGWWANGPKPEKIQEKSGVGRGSQMMWTSGYAVPERGREFDGLWASIGGSAIERRGFAGELPESTPLFIACQRQALAAAQTLVRLGARSAFGQSERPANWQAGKLMAANALSSDASEREALGWARLALRALAPQSERSAENLGIGISSSAAVILALARSAREALMISARALRQGDEQAVQEGDLIAGLGLGRLPEPAASGWLRAILTSRQRRLDLQFWTALGLRDRARMGDWAKAAKKRAQSRGESLRVNGLPPAAWVCALAAAEEARARDEQRASRIMGRGAAALFDALSRELGVSALDEPVGAWGNLAPVQAAAVCDAPAACQTLLELGASAGASGDPQSGLLAMAARGLSVEVHEVMLPYAQRDLAPVVGASHWIAASMPAEAQKTLRAASAGQEAAFGERWEEPLSLLQAASEKKLASLAKKSSDSPKLEEWRKLIALVESLSIASCLRQGARKPDAQAEGPAESHAESRVDGQANPAEKARLEPAEQKRAAPRAIAKRL